MCGSFPYPWALELTAGRVTFFMKLLCKSICKLYFFRTLEVCYVGLTVQWTGWRSCKSVCAVLQKIYVECDVCITLLSTTFCMDTVPLVGNVLLSSFSHWQTINSVRTTTEWCSETRFTRWAARDNGSSTADSTYGSDSSSSICYIRCVYKSFCVCVLWLIVTYLFIDSKVSVKCYLVHLKALLFIFLFL